MLRRHWVLASALAAQIAIWLSIPHSSVPGINVVSQIGDMRSLFGIGEAINNQFVAPWHPVASFLTLPSLLWFDDPLLGGRIVWLLLHLSLTVLLYYIGRTLFSQMTAWFAIFSVVFGAPYYESSLSLSTEMCSFVLSLVPLALFARFRNRPIKSLDFAVLGLCCGAVTLSRVEYGFVFPVYLLLYLHRDSKYISMRALVMSTLLALTMFVMIIMPQVIWVNVAHGTYGLMSPYEQVTFGSAAYYVPESLYQIAEARSIKTPWEVPELTLETLTQTINTVIVLLANKSYFPHLLKLLVVGTAVYFIIQIPATKTEHIATLVIAIAIPTLNVLATMTAGINLSVRRLWSSNPFVLLLAGFGFSLVVHSMMDRWNLLIKSITKNSNLKMFIGSIAVVVILALTGPVTIWYMLTDETRLALHEQASAIAQLQRFFNNPEKQIMPVACPTVQVAFLIGTPYIPFRFDLPESVTPEIWVQKMREWGAEYVIFFPSIRARLPYSMRQGIERFLTNSGAVVLKTDVCALYQIPPLSATMHGVTSDIPL